MSCERPVILAGSQGYLGIFTAAGLEEAIRTNFTGRDHAEVTAEALVNDLRTLLNEYSAEERQHLGIIGRQVVEKYYSGQTMVRLTHEFYQKVLLGSY
jgi:glycosyltransferase involved in cell wall biosynthesis